MINPQLIQLILSAVSEAFIVTQAIAYNKEVVDGGTKNKIWSFLSFIVTIPWLLSPLARIFPAVNFGLYQWLIMGLSGGICYVASVAHHNQICRNQDDLDKITKLPYDLHENKYIMDSALFLSRYLVQIFTPIYIISLVGCIFLGAPTYAYISLTMYTLNLLYQHDYFPSILKGPYRYLNVLAVSSATLGLTSWLNIAFFASGVAFTIFDYVICHMRQEVSPTSQFPMANSKNKLTVMPINNDTPEGSKALLSLLNKHRNYKSASSLEGEKLRFGIQGDWIFYVFSRVSGYPIKTIKYAFKGLFFHETIKLEGVHVTFNHFYESYRIVEKILADTPALNYDDYIDLFNQADFQSPSFRDLITNQMSLHDKYNEHPSGQRCIELGLPADTSTIDVQIAYLKREMGYFVERLNRPSYRDLNPQQVAVLHQYARLILTKVSSLPFEERNTILVSLAITTGSHCNRIYLETLSSLAEELGFLIEDTLSLREKAILQAQGARETRFRTYYYETVALFKQNPKKGYMFKTFFSNVDIDDYHTYEGFVQVFGANLYLRNPTLSLRNRTTQDVYRDQMIHHYLSQFDFTDEKMLFSQVYNPSYLVNQVLDPRGKLHKVFIEWCEEHFPSYYQDVLYDQDYLLKTSPNTTALAELMLLDFDILTLDTPYSEVEIPIDQLVRLKFALVVRQETELYLIEKGKSITRLEYYDCYKPLLKNIEKEGVIVIWQEIKDRVATQMFDEFDMLYENKEDFNFTSLVDTGRQVDLEFTSIFYTNLDWFGFMQSTDNKKALGKALISSSMFLPASEAESKNENGDLSSNTLIESENYTSYTK